MLNDERRKLMRFVDSAEKSYMRVRGEAPPSGPPPQERTARSGYTRPHGPFTAGSAAPREAETWHQSKAKPEPEPKADAGTSSPEIAAAIRAAVKLGLPKNAVTATIKAHPEWAGELANVILQNILNSWRRYT